MQRSDFNQPHDLRTRTSWIFATFVIVLACSHACSRPQSVSPKRPVEYTSTVASPVQISWFRMKHGTTCTFEMHNTLNTAIVIKPPSMWFRSPLVELGSYQVDSLSYDDRHHVERHSADSVFTQDFILWPSQRVVFTVLVSNVEMNRALANELTEIEVRCIMFRPLEASDYVIAVWPRPAPDTFRLTLRHDSATATLFDHLIDDRYPRTTTSWIHPSSFEVSGFRLIEFTDSKTILHQQRYEFE